MPLQLDPTLPTDKPVTKRERYSEKFGASKLKDMETMMKQRFASEGLEITYDGVVRQTTLSHRLIAKAWDVGKQSATEKSDQEAEKAAEAMQLRTIEKIYQAYFSDAKDIGDPAVLAPIAAETGVFKDKETAKAWLEGTEGMDKYREGVLSAQMMGIRGVPFFRYVEYARY
jgi:predicted DsbA family dithiol-disulfide isomerase